MKKYFYYIVVFIVLIYNYKLISDYNNYSEKLKTANKAESVVEEVKESVNYLHSIANSDYLGKIQKINVNGDKTTIIFNVNKDDNYKKIVENTEKILGNTSNNISIEDDKQMIVEFE